MAVVQTTSKSGEKNGPGIFLPVALGLTDGAFFSYQLHFTERQRDNLGQITAPSNYRIEKTTTLLKYES